jgi:hypothetical protein
MARNHKIKFALAAASLSFAVATTAFAEHATVTTPNPTLLRSGVITLGAAYVPAFVVGVQSPRAVDRNLTVPLAGPWMDLAQRGCPGCAEDRLSKVLLVTDGIFQGIGALNIVGSFLFPKVRVVALSESTVIAFSPARLPAGGFGVNANGVF